MNRYFIYLAYNGGNYCGWQNQPNATTVQEVIEKSLSTVLRTPTSITGAGRTDTGVHARQMTAHFDAANIDTHILTDKLNRILPNDIVVYNIVEVKPEAHARFDATARLYKYYITTQKDPFLHPFKYRVPTPSLDIEMMNKCAKILFEYTDFTSFSKLHTDVKTNDCTIIQADWTQIDHDFIFTIKANRFLRNMVRAIVGTLFEAGRGRLDERGMRRIIEAKNRAVAGQSAPAHALFLESVDYPDSIFEIER